MRRKREATVHFAEPIFTSAVGGAAIEESNAVPLRTSPARPTAPDVSSGAEGSEREEMLSQLRSKGHETH